MTQAGTRRQRISRSCTACRTAKTRCSGKNPCSRCLLRRNTCVYDIEPSRAPSLSEEILVSPPSSISQAVQHESQDSLSWYLLCLSYFFCLSNRLTLGLFRQIFLVQRLSGNWLKSSSPISIPFAVLGSFINRRLCSAWMRDWRRVIMKACFCILYAHWVQSRILFMQCVWDWGLTIPRFYALEYSTTVRSLPSNFVLSAGNEWAKKSRALILGDLNDISVEKLMVVSLL